LACSADIIQRDEIHFFHFATLVIGMPLGFSQGFVNLNFESATIVQDTSSIFYPHAVYASNAIPGWTITGANFLGPDEILYDTVSTGSSSISLFDTNGFPAVLGGRYSVGLYGGSNPSGVSISQTGVVPESALSLFFRAQSAIGTLLVSLGGQNLSYFAVTNASNYTLYGATIPAELAGQSEQLQFYALQGNNNYWTIDNIGFSSSPIPEPSELALAALGTLLFVVRRWRNS
jgi:hypothetical protein